MTTAIAGRAAKLATIATAIAAAPRRAPARTANGTATRNAIASARESAARKTSACHVVANGSTTTWRGYVAPTDVPAR
jgi:hypothetical protein